MINKTNLMGMNKDNQIIEVEKDRFGNYESKIKYIIKNDKEILKSLKNDDSRIEYFINHFIMSDFDTKQLQNYLKRYGTEGFFELIGKAILS